MGEAFFEAEVFAVAGGVLADEGDLADALGDEVLGLGDDGAHAARAELAAQLRDDAEAAGMIAAFGDLDVGGGARRGEDARGLVGVEVAGKGGGSAVPGLAGEAAGLLAGVAFGAAGGGAGLGEGLARSRVAGDVVGAGVLVDGGGGAVDELLLGDVLVGLAATVVSLTVGWGGVRGRAGCGLRCWAGRSPAGGSGRANRTWGSLSWREACSREDGFEFAGADDGVDLGDVGADLVAIALDEAAGDDDAAMLCRRFRACAGPSRGWC